MDSEEIPLWDEESERAWQKDNHDVTMPEAVVTLLSNILVPCAKILDAGCGIGKHLKALTELGYDVVGIDQSKKAVEHARELNPAAKIFLMRIQDLNVPNSFNLIHTSGVLQHSTNERKNLILSQFCMALKPMGYLLCTENTLTPENIHHHYKKEGNTMKQLTYSEDATDDYSFTEKGWIDFMATNRFRHLKTIPPCPYYLYQCEK